MYISVYDADDPDKPISGASLTLIRLSDNTNFSDKTDPSGEKCFPNLKSGKYSIEIKKEDYETKVDTTIKVIINTTNKYSYSLKAKPASLNLEPTIEVKLLDFGVSSNTEQFRFRNDHDVEISWKIFHSCNWIKSILSHSNEQDFGILAPKKTETVTVIIDRTKLPQAGSNEDNISVGTSEQGGAKVTIRAFKETIKPEKATITGNNENICPETSVMLTANATGAASYKWYNGNTAISGINADKYEVTKNGTYYVLGINAMGEGLKSDGKVVSIISCPTIPARATISSQPSNATNNCPSTIVTLTASATHATSYKWYKGSDLLSETSSTLIVTENGIYYAKGINISGESTLQSLPKEVTINPCLPSRATISALPSNGINSCPSTTVTLTASSTNATSYKWYKENTVLNETSNTLSANESGTYYVRGVNASGESAQQSLPKYVTINSCIPGTPANVRASKDGNNIRVDWNTVSLATKYKVKMCNNDASICYDRETTSTYYIFKESDGVLFCGTHHFEVVAVNDVGQSPSPGTNSYNRVITLRKPLLYADPSSGSVSLSWSSATPQGATGTVYYEIYRRIGNESNWGTPINTTTNTYYTDTFPCPGWYTPVSYKLRAYMTICPGIENGDETTTVCY
ncbi:MAG: carboxypeptidase regulatory-like domain-containing protein [Lentimicrobiaceae bacterium]|nr:carboxypeptidase regulatory-like domain-containing protein [Lentimicrobiaceae bacterium]